MIIISDAHTKDAEEILALQKLAYQSEAEIYGDFTIEPLHQTVDQKIQEMEIQTFLAAVSDNQIVGSVKAYQEGDTCFIGKLIVHSKLQNRGLGKKLMCEIESQFQSAQRFELFTGFRSEKNLYFYRKLGYEIFREQKINEVLSLVYLEKCHV